MVSLRGLALAAAGACAAAQNITWKIIAKDVGTIATGIAFNADGLTGFLPADSNGVGSAILKSVDGGFTWNYSAPHPFNLLFLDVASSLNNVVVAGIFGTEFSLDTGETFNSSLGGGGTCQCTRNLYDHDSPDGFGLAGQFGLVQTNGVAISTDFGITFTAIGIPQLTTLSRYAAFPGPAAWYVAAGNFGDSAVQPPEGTTLVKRITSRIALVKDKKTGATRHAFTLGAGSASGGRALQSADDDGAAYAAEIVASFDGGKTWATQFNNTGEYYFNGIECTSASNCCAVAEADNGPDAGSYIFCTSNSGATWNATHVNKDPASSLLDIAAVGPNELWAVGGEFGSLGPTAAHFWHSVDGGQTWALESQIAGEYASAIDCVPGKKQCWATTLDILQTSSVASFTPSA